MGTETKFEIGDKVKVNLLHGRSGVPTYRYDYGQVEGFNPFGVPNVLFEDGTTCLIELSRLEAVTESEQAQRVIRDRMRVVIAAEEGNVDLSFGYIGNTYGIEGTPAYRDDRCWTVWLKNFGRDITGNHHNVGYYRTSELDALRVHVEFGAIERMIEKAVAR